MKKHYKEKVCTICNKVYTPVAGNQKICSDECRNIRAPRYNVKTYTKKICRNCSKSFTPRSKRGVYCNDCVPTTDRVFRRHDKRGKEMECITCGEIFIPSKSIQFNCSTICSKKHRKMSISLRVNNKSEHRERV